MELYRVVKGPVTIGPGTAMSLDDRQYEMRKHAAEPHLDDAGKPLLAAGRRIVTATVPAQFKMGETIGLDGVLPKSLSERLMSAAEDAAFAADSEAAAREGRVPPAARPTGGKPSEPTKPVAAFPPQGEKARKKA